MNTSTKSVSKFEARVIALARAIVGDTPVESALPYLLDKISVPPAVGTNCLQLTCDTLAKGCVQYLARVGGWRNDRFLRGGRPTEGRLWNRIPLDERRLIFSRHVWDFLIWLTAYRPSSAKPWLPPTDEVTIADQLFIGMAYSTFHDTEAGLSWPQRPVFARNLLCRLLWPGDFGSMTMHPPDGSAWGSGMGTSILEAHQSTLEDRWLAIEREKSEVNEWHSMRQLAGAQNLVVEHYLSTIGTHRRDLARFLIRAASRFCIPGVRAEHLTASLTLSHETRLAERFLVRREAAVLARTLDRLSSWERESRLVGFLDEGYGAAQFFLSEWEAANAGSALIVARDLLRQLEPLGSGGEIDESGLSGERQRVATASDSGD